MININFNFFFILINVSYITIFTPKRIGFNNWGKRFQYDLETEEIGIATYEGYRLNAFLGELIVQD